MIKPTPRHHQVNRFPRCYFAGIGLLFVFLVGFWAGSVLGQNRDEPLSAARVQTAIDNAIMYLKGNQRADGSWEGYESYGSTSQTALIALACLNAGVSPQDRMLDRAMKFIESSPPTHTYEASLQTMVFSSVSPIKYESLILRNIKWLEKAQKNGGWTYNQTDFGTDPSNSQFAVLAIWEAQRVGIPVSESVLEAANKYWMAKVNGDGSWSYGERNTPGTGSMTCAGIASLLMTRDALDQADANVVNGEIQCCGNVSEADPVERGMKWLANNFTINGNPGGGGNFTLYYLYALERTGRLTGNRYIANHDWYREGSEFLVRQQDPIQKYFPGGLSETNSRATTTALGLLFLAKGKRQTVMGRLQYGETSDWSLHRSAMQNLTGHIETVWKRDLAWQSIKLERASLADLLECPVIFISGRSELRLTAPQKILLKDYIQQGGFLFAEACNGDGCDGIAFDRSFRALIEELFEKPLTKLPPDHPIWFAEAKVDPKAFPKDFWLYGVEDCCRTSVVYSPISLSCRWELNRPYGRKRPLPDRLAAELQNAAKIGINVAAYATGRELKEKLDRVDIIEPIADLAPTARGTLVLPKLQNSGDSNEVPRALTNLMEIFRKERPTLLSSKPLTIPVTPEELEKYSPVYIHGRKSFAFNPQERLAMRTYFENGGVLIGDAVCASEEFVKSFRFEMAAILPEAKSSSVPNSHMMLTKECGGFDIRSVTFINPSNNADKTIEIRRRKGPPVLEMLTWNDRVVAVFSPYDLSCALENRNSVQCMGYDRPDAAQIAINLILFARYAGSSK